MDIFKDCSNLPQFEGKFQPPFEKKLYVLDKCQFSQDSFPNHVLEGFYKIVAVGYGDVEWSMAFIFQVENEY